MSDEYTSYQVPGQQLRYRVAQLNAAGIPFNVAGQSGGVYIIVVPMAYATGIDNLPQPQYRRKPWWMPSRRRLVTLAMVAVVAAGAYMVFSGGIRITGVSVPKVNLPAVEVPKVTNPLAGVNASLDQTAASINHAADAARNAAVTFIVIVGGLFAAGGIYAMRGPLAMVGRGLVGTVSAAARAAGKAVHRG